MGYYVEGLLVTKRRKILATYMKMEFWLDSISLAVLIIYMAVGSSKLVYLKLLFYLKCYQLSDYDGKAQRIV